MPVLIRLLLCGMALGMLSTLPAGAGEFNDVLSIGDPAPAWKNLPGTDGKSHSFSDLTDKPVVVVVFTCASCPTASDYETRIQTLANTYGEQVAVTAICVNQIEEDQLPALTKRAQEKKLTFQYLSDQSQKIAKDYGAVFTPQFYVLDRDRKIIYMGAMDDSTDPEKVTRRYVEEAIKAALNGDQPEIKEMMPRGCRVRYARQRRGRGMR